MKERISDLISFVIPCYYSAEYVGKVVDEIKSVMESQHKFDYEIILVNDGSKDNTYNVISDLALRYHKICAVNLSKNYGQASAMMKGFSEVRGEYIVNLDDDGQCPIERIFDMLCELEKGYDAVFAYYDDIKQKWYRNLGSFVNKKMAELLIGQPKNVRISSFWIGRRYLIDAIVSYTGPFPYIAGILLSITDNISAILVEQRERKDGTSGYTFKKLISLWLNGFTAFSVVPLRLTTFLGLISGFSGFAFSLVVVIRKLINPNILLGYASTMSVILFISGIVLIGMGLLGEYVGRIYLTVNKRPQYIEKEKTDNRREQS